MKPYGVRVKMIDSKWRLTTVEKFFGTEKARNKWLDRKQAHIHEILAYC